ncbi:MAG TPA: cupin domain-containing protein [Steroidobacteraceae bacterium]
MRGGTRLGRKNPAKGLKFQLAARHRLSLGAPLGVSPGHAHCAGAVVFIKLLEKEMPQVPFAALKRQPLLIEPLPDANPVVRLVKGARIRFAPGQPTGLHRHSMSTCGVVTAGTFTFQPEGEEARELRTGDAFFEAAGRTILQFDNASSTEPAEIVCFYLTDTDSRPAIEMLSA